MTAYDTIADWYETTFLTGQRDDPLGIEATLHELLGPGAGSCLELGCGTGIHAGTIRELGRRPLGIDVSAGMLRHATGRLPVARGDAEALPVATGSLPAVVAVMVHTDMPAYPAVLREAARVLAPGGVFVHVGVHPCFCGGFADRSDERAVVIRPGYRDPGWTTASWTDRGLRDKVGAAHLPLPARRAQPDGPRLAGAKSFAVVVESGLPRLTPWQEVIEEAAMTKEFEVGFEGTLAGTPDQCWRAVTVEAGSWSWPISYEPRAGGRETGLTFYGGEVTVWQPDEHFATRCEKDGWFNELDYTFEPRGDATHLKFVHRGVFLEDWDTNYDACRKHTAFYYHSLGEYLAHFPGRSATYAMTEAPESSAEPGGFAKLKKALGVPDDVQAGDRLAVRGHDGVVDYVTPEFLGVRTADALYRFYGRNAFGWPIGVGRHHFAEVDADAEGWDAWLAEVFG